MGNHNWSSVIKAQNKSAAMTYHIETITPAMAETMLESLDPDQRTLKPTRVETFATIMRRGEFLLTHQGIAISSTGTLIDGQHRLAALMVYGKPIQMYVARNAPQTMIQAIDGGAVRSPADRLHIPNRHVAVLNALATSVMHQRNITDGLRKRIWSDVGGNIVALDDFAPSQAKYITNGYLKAAVVLRMAYQKEREYVTQQYRAMSIGHFADFSPRISALYHQLTTSRNMSGAVIRANTRDVLMRAWTGFDPTRASVAGINIKDKDGMLETITNEIKKQIPALSEV